ncbi:MAG: carbohydrate kinase family protein [Pseudomonadota bacterium]
MERAIACLGAANIDRKAQSLQPVVLGSSNPVRTTERPGGVARNVCENLARLECKVGLFAPLGDDGAGAAIRDSLVALGVTMAPGIQAASLPTATYTALTDPKGELVVGIADLAICDAVPADPSSQLMDFLSGYSTWFFDTNLPRAFLQRLVLDRPNHVTVAVDTVSVAKARKLEDFLDSIDMLFCNADEAAALAGATKKAPLDIIMTAHGLRDQGVDTIVITYGSDGCYVAGDGVGDFIPAFPVTLMDVTGAGDALTAGTLYGRATGMPIDQAIRQGLAAAAITCQTMHTVSPDISRGRLQEIIDHE